MLTAAAVKAARPRSRGYKIFDEGGLHLYVAPNGRRSFRMRFRRDGGEQLLTFGTWPELSLTDARARCEAAREQLGRGEDPRGASPVYEYAQTRSFGDACVAWHAHMRARWTEVHAADVLASLRRDVLPELGDMPIEHITTPVVLSALRLVEQRGCLETARRIRQRISAVFAFAMSEGAVKSDPAAIVGRALMPPGPQRRQPAIVDIEQLRALLAAVDRLAAPAAAKLASRFLALTAVRIAAVRGARWDEIEDLDGAAPVWRVPAARMKMAAAKKADSGNDHIVPLSPQAVAVLRSARESGYHPRFPVALIFPGRCPDRAIGAAAIGALYARAGFAGQHVPHGWRASFSTIMHEARPEDSDIIERALAHAPKDKVKAAYDRAKHLERRRSLFERWGSLVGDQQIGVV